MTLDQEAAEAKRLLAGKQLAHVRRNRASEILLEFSDGTRLFVEGKAGAEIELSVTGAD